MVEFHTALENDLLTDVRSIFGTIFFIREHKIFVTLLKTFGCISKGITMSYFPKVF